MDVYKSWPISNMGPGQGNLKDLGLWGPLEQEESAPDRA